MDIGTIIVIVLILVVVGLVALRLARRRKQRQSLEVFHYGKTVVATVTDIEEQTVLTMVTDVPQLVKRYSIRAEWIDPQTLHRYTFTSNPLSGIPGHIHIGGPIRVKIDLNRPDEYLVDIAP